MICDTSAYSSFLISFKVFFFQGRRKRKFFSKMEAELQYLLTQAGVKEATINVLEKEEVNTNSIDRFLPTFL
jgi:hypothetical protein